MRLGKTIYFYALLLKAIFQEWRKSSHTAFDLLTESWRLSRINNAQMFVQSVMARWLIPNYRLKVKIKLGRPSSTIFRKFHEEIQADSAWVSTVAIQARQQPKYLIIRDGAMGDVLMLTPVVRALHARHGGDIAIDIATQAKVVFDSNPYVRSVLNPKALKQGVHTYDVVIDLNDAYERFPDTHPVNAYGKLVLGVGDFDKSLDLYPTPEDIQWIDSVVAEIGGPYVVVHHFCHEWPNREIDSAVWGGLLSGFAQQKRFKVIYVGVDRDYAEILSDDFQDHRGKYSIQQLSLLIAKSEGFLGGDSGPSHIAATTNAPMCIFYTCAHHEARMPLRSAGRFLPLKPDMDCYGCLTHSPIPRPGYFCYRGDNVCVHAFDTSEITNRVLSFFEKK